MNKLMCNVWEYAIIMNQQEEFLILKLPISKEFHEEKWMLPGGRLTTDDEPEFWLKREIEEETGLKVDIISPIHVAKRGTPQKYSVFFLCKLMGIQNVKISNEHIESKRIKFTDIEKIEWHNSNSKIAAEKAKILIKKII